MIIAAIVDVMRVIPKNFKLSIIHLCWHSLSQFQIQKIPAKASTRAYQQIMLLVQEMYSHIPQPAMLQRPEVTQDTDDARQTQGPYEFACTFYGIRDSFTTPPSEGHFTIPFSSTFESLISCSEKCAQELEKEKDVVILRGVFSGILGLLNVMVNRLATPVEVTWDPAVWLGLMLQSMTYEVCLCLSLYLFWLTFPSSLPFSLLSIGSSTLAFLSIKFRSSNRD